MDKKSRDKPEAEEEFVERVKADAMEKLGKVRVDMSKDKLDAAFALSESSYLGNLSKSPKMQSGEMLKK